MIARILIQAEAFDAESAELRGDDFRHLCKSLRRRVGDQVEVTDGAGRKRLGVLTEVARDQAIVELGSPLECPDVVSHVSIFSCVPRPERASWLVEKCTELGVREFSFFDAEHSARAMSDKGLDRLRRVAKSALLQCGGCWLPSLRQLGDLSRLCRLIAERRAAGEVVFVLEPGADQGLLEQSNSKRQRVTLILGPEGGLAEHEVAELVNAGCTAVALGASLLRMETAAVSGAALLLARL